MHAERDHLVKVTIPRLREWCENRRLRLIDIDLRWGVTREDAESGKAVELCLQEIDRCRPFFVCILGNRYGSVPDVPPEGNLFPIVGIQPETGFSITHLEIIHATETPLPRRDGGQSPVCRHAFFYFRRPECLPPPESLTALTAEQRAEYAEGFFEQTEDRARKLWELKDRIRRSPGNRDRVYDYAGVWDPEAENPEEEKLKGRLTQLDDFGLRVEADLRAALELEFADHLAALETPATEVDEERSRHAEFAELRSQLHICRAEIEAKLTQYANASEPRQALVLSGAPGAGKTAVLAHWTTGRGIPPGPATGAETLVFRFIGASPASTRLPALLRSICEELRQRLNLALPPAPAGPREIRAQWPRFLQEAAQRSRIVIVLDALNQLDRGALPAQAFWLPRELPRGVRMIASVIDHGGISARTENGAPEDDWLAELRRRGVVEVPVPELTEEECFQIVRTVPSVFCKTLDAGQIRALQQNRATRNALFLTVALEELRVFGSAGKLSAAIAALPKPERPDDPESIDKAVGRLFEQVLERLERESGRATPGLVPALFSLLASSRDGLSERELEGMLEPLLAGTPEPVRNGQMQVVLRQVRYGMQRKQAHGTVLIDFYHRGFWKAVVRKYLDSDALKAACHLKIASFFASRDYFLGSADALREHARRLPPAPRPVALHKVVELPWQCIRAAVAEERAQQWAAWGLTAGLLTNWQFLEAKAEAGLVYELIGDFSEALARMPADYPERLNIELIAEALRRDAGFVSQHPTSLFQCLWNSCWWYDCPGGAKHYEETHRQVRENDREEDQRLCTVLQRWRSERERRGGYFPWARSRRPPAVRLGSGSVAMFGGHTMGVKAVACPSGEFDMLVSASWDDTIRVWNASTGEMLLSIEEPGVNALAVSPARSRFAALGERFIRIWELPSGQLERTLEAPQGTACLVFDPGQELLSCSGTGGRVVTWDAVSGEVVSDATFGAPGSDPGVLSANGRFVAVSDADGVRVFEVASGRAVGTLAGASAGCFALSDDGASLAGGGRRHEGSGRMAGGGDNAAVVIWDVAAGSRVCVLEGHSSFISCIAFSPDGSRVASGGGLTDNTVRIWDVKNHKEERVLRGHQDYVYSLVFAGEGRRVVTGAIDRTIQVWRLDVPGGEYRLREHRFPILGDIQFTPDGRSVASASLPQLRVWDTESGLCLGVNEPGDLMRLPSDSSRYRATPGHNATQIELASSGAPVCWIPGELEHCAFHSVRNLFGGNEEESPHLQLFSIEYENDAQRAGFDPGENATSFDRLRHLQPVVALVSPRDLQKTQVYSVAQGNFEMYLSSILDETQYWQSCGEFECVRYLLAVTEEFQELIEDKSIAVRMYARHADALAALGRFSDALEKCEEAVKICRRQGWSEEERALADYQRQLSLRMPRGSG